MLWTCLFKQKHCGRAILKKSFFQWLCVIKKNSWSVNKISKTNNYSPFCNAGLKLRKTYKKNITISVVEMRKKQYKVWFWLIFIRSYVNGCGDFQASITWTFQRKSNPIAEMTKTITVVSVMSQFCVQCWLTFVRVNIFFELQ